MRFIAPPGFGIESTSLLKPVCTQQRSISIDSVDLDRRRFPQPLAIRFRRGEHLRLRVEVAEPDGAAQPPSAVPEHVQALGDGAFVDEAFVVVRRSGATDLVDHLTGRRGDRCEPSRMADGTSTATRAAEAAKVPASSNSTVAGSTGEPSEGPTRRRPGRRLRPRRGRPPPGEEPPAGRQLLPRTN